MGEREPEFWDVSGVPGVVIREDRSMLGSSGVVASDDNAYRYILWRSWGAPWSRPRDHCAWVMLNPSVADAVEGDPTIAKCVGFSHRHGHEGIVVVNLFALRSTDPKVLVSSRDPVGPHNPRFVHQVLGHPAVSRVVLAWGNDGELDARDEAFCVVHAGRELWCLQPPGKPALTKTGSPRHPGRISYASELRRVTWDGALSVMEGTS